MRPSESRRVDVNLEGWTMNIYQIYSAVDNKDAYADLKQADRKIIDFINYNEGRYTNEAVLLLKAAILLQTFTKRITFKPFPKCYCFLKILLINWLRH